MAQTQKTLAAAYAALPDNNIQSASTQNVRDLGESLRPSYIGVTMLDSKAPQSIPIATQDTWTNIVLDLDEVMSSDNLSLVDTTIQYTGSVPIVLHTTIAMTLTTASANNQEIKLAGRLNGVVADLATYSLQVNKNVEPVTFPLVYMALISPNDLLGISIMNTTSDDDLSCTEFTANHFTLPYEA